MAGGRKAFEPNDIGAGRVDVRLRYRRDLAPERVEVVAVQPPRTLLEPGRIDQVRRPDLGDVHLEPGMLSDEHAGGARVVDVDVRDQQVAQVGELEVALAQAFLQPREAARRPAVEERRPVRGLEQVAPDHPLRAAMHEIKRFRRHGPDASEGGGAAPAPLAGLLLVGPVRR